MTSNRPTEDWGKLLEDVPSAAAILDHFLHHAEIISCQGRSYRLHSRPADGGAVTDRKGSETDPQPASAPTGKERRLRGRGAVADQKTGTDGTNRTKPFGCRSEEVDSFTQYPPL